MEKFHELYFEEDEIPARMRKGLRDLELISGSETHCRRYILLLARTCDVRTFFLLNCLRFADECSLNSRKSLKIVLIGHSTDES